MTEATINALVVEDNPGDARLLRELLLERSPNAHLVHASSLADALQVVTRESFDVALLDLELPDAVGLDSVRQMRIAAPELALIVLSGRDDNDIAVRSLQEGAQDYLTKGQIDASLLARAIRYSIERQKTRVALLNLLLVDELTGLYNLRGFVDLAAHELKRARRTMKPFALLYADVNVLKVINDTFGHRVGNRALVDMAVILKQSIRNADFVGRLGGDEFCAFAVDATQEVADAIRRRLDERLHVLNAQPGRLYALSFSMGVLCCQPDETRPFDELLTEADARMYIDKRARARS